MSQGLPILMYHGLDDSGSVISTELPWFIATLRAFHRAGFRTVDLDDWIDQGRPDLDRAFAISFDDGLRSILSAVEAFDRFGFTATVFLVTEWMGRDNAWPGQPGGIAKQAVLSWSEAARLRDAGFRFGAHTRHHPRLDRLDDDAIRDELRGSRREIEERLGQSCRLLAYPYGLATERVRTVASEEFSAAFGTRLKRASARDDAWALPRIDAFEVRSPRALSALIRGLEGPWFRIRRASRAAGRAVRDRPGRQRPRLDAA